MFRAARKLTTSAQVESTKKVAHAFIVKAHAIALPIIFVSRVSLEIIKQVAKTQNLFTLGSFTEAQAGLGRFFTSFQTGAWKKVTVKESVYLTSQVGTVLGFFIVGEMVPSFGNSI